MSRRDLRSIVGALIFSRLPTPRKVKDALLFVSGVFFTAERVFSPRLAQRINFLKK